MTIDSADDSKISNQTINTNRISNRMYDSKSNRITKLCRSLPYSYTNKLFSLSTSGSYRTLPSNRQHSYGQMQPTHRTPWQVNSIFRRPEMDWSQQIISHLFCPEHLVMCTKPDCCLHRFRLHAPPITAVRLMLSDEDVRVTVAHRQGCNAFKPHICVCGKAVDYGVYTDCSAPRQLQR